MTTKTLAPPHTCLLTISNTCNLQCRMCDLWRKDTTQEEVSIAEWISFIDTLYAFEGDPLEIHLIGGETFIKDGVFDLITYARAHGSRVVVTTSGYPVNDKIAQHIARAKLSLLNFSLESLRPETHDFLRGIQGIQKKVLEGIRLVAENAPQTEIAINTIILKDNLYDLVDLVRWVDETDAISHIYFMAVMRPFGSDLALSWQNTERASLLWPNNSAEVEYVIDQLITLKERGSKIANSVGQFEVFKKYFREPQNFIKRTGCTLDTHALNINAIGDAYLCFFKEKVGNIREKTAQAMWYSDVADRVRSQINECRANCELIVNCYYEDE